MKIDTLRSDWFTDANLTPNMVTGNAGRMVTYAMSDGLQRLSDITAAQVAVATGLSQPVVLPNQVTAHAIYVVDCVEGDQGKLRGYALGIDQSSTPGFNGEYKLFQGHWYNAVTGSPQYEAAFEHVYTILTNNQVSSRTR